MPVPAARVPATGPAGRAGSWSEQLLRYLWYVTWQHVEALPAEVEALWTTAAANTRNIVPVLDYLISKCTHSEEVGSEVSASLLS